jgi:hypothetical protein
MTTGSRRSGALGAAADGDWKTTGGRPGLEERRGRRPVVGETSWRRWRWDRERMAAGIGMERGAEEDEETLGFVFILI